MDDFEQFPASFDQTVERLEEKPPKVNFYEDPLEKKSLKKKNISIRDCLVVFAGNDLCFIKSHKINEFTYSGLAKIYFDNLDKKMYMMHGYGKM